MERKNNDNCIYIYIYIYIADTYFTNKRELNSYNAAHYLIFQNKIKNTGLRSFYFGEFNSRV